MAAPHGFEIGAAHYLFHPQEHVLKDARCESTRFASIHLTSHRVCLSTPRLHQLMYLNQSQKVFQRTGASLLWLVYPAMKVRIRE